MGQELFSINSEVERYELRSLLYEELVCTQNINNKNYDFYEIIYVDKGKISCCIDNQIYGLKQCEAIIISPKVNYNLWVDNKPTNIIRISFYIKIGDINKFSNKIITLNEFQKEILVRIIEVSEKSFYSVDKKCTKDLWGIPKKNDKENFECINLIKKYVEIFIIELFRNTRINKYNNKVCINNKIYNEKLNNILEYMEKNIHKPLTIKNIAYDCHICESSVKQIFKSYFNMGAIEYFRKLKIEQAKLYIREGKMNFTEISQSLGYSSIHYFSKQFSNIVKMSPTEYYSRIMKK